MRRILIIGANSAVAEATARHFATPNNALSVASRVGMSLAANPANQNVRGAAHVATATLSHGFIPQRATL